MGFSKPSVCRAAANLKRKGNLFTAVLRLRGILKYKQVWQPVIFEAEKGQTYCVNNTRNRIILCHTYIESANIVAYTYGELKQ